MSSLNPPSRRRSVRREFRTECQAVRLDEFRLVGERILDLSPSGALIHCTDAVSPGDELVVSFRAPGDGPVVDATAQVRRVFTKHGRPVAGASFVDLDAETEHVLSQRLTNLPPPVPASARPIDYADEVWRIAEGAA